MALNGPYWNPTLFRLTIILVVLVVILMVIIMMTIDNMMIRIGESRCSLQAQLPWLFMIPIFYAILNWQYRWLIIL